MRIAKLATAGRLASGATWAALAVVAVWLVLGGAAQVTQAAETVQLVVDGQAKGVIQVAADASPSEKWAAEELVSYLKQMSGADVGVAITNGDKLDMYDQPFIVLGSKAVKAGLVTLDGLGPDGYVIKVSGNRIAIAGDPQRGTMYGVFAFLEKLGVRWWTPTETFVPRMKTIELAAMELRETPRLEYRDMMYPEIFATRISDTEKSYEGPIWAAHNKVNGMAWDDVPEKFGGRYLVSGNLVHSYATLLKESGLTLTPEMMAFRKDAKGQGQRVDPARIATNQPCLTNPEVLAATVKAVVARYKADPKLEFVVVGQEDNRNFCQCDKCAAIDQAEESNAGQVIAFANLVAEAVEKQVPGARIATAAYEWSRKPPKKLRPRANLYITLCSIECNFTQPLGSGAAAENKSFKEDIELWGKIAPKLFIWHYCGNREHYYMPNPDLATFTPNAKFFADNNVRGVFVQGTHVGRSTEFRPLRMWLWARALWNTQGDNQAAIKEFCDGYYGPAGPAVLSYIALLHQSAAETDYHNGRRAYLDAPFLKPEVMAAGEAAMRQAAAAAKGNADLERRVRQARMPITYMLFKRGPQSKTWAAVEAKVGPLDAVAMAEEFAATVKEWQINYTGDPEDMAAFVNWMKDYAKLIVEKKGQIAPPELAAAAPGSYRLVQACQMDARSNYWKPMAGASDGWVLAAKSGVQMNSWKPSPFDDYTPGKSYRLMARFKVAKPTGTGAAVSIGVRGPNEPAPWKFRVTVKAEDVKAEEWQTVEVCVRKFQPGDAVSFVCEKAAPQADLDAFWLIEVPEGTQPAASGR